MLDRNLVFGDVTASQKIEDVLAEPLRVLLGKRAPCDALAVEQRNEKFGPRPMNVGVGDGHRFVFDMDDQHVRIRRANVVLDRKAPVRTHRRGAEPGMTEGQWGSVI